MSLWNVTRVVRGSTVTPLIMGAEEMYVIITITMMTMTQGLLQACYQFCKLSPDHSSIGRPECDCSFYNLREIRSTALNPQTATTSVFKDRSDIYDHLAFNYSLSPSLAEYNTTRLVSSLKTPNVLKQNEHRKTNNTNTESFAEEDNTKQQSITSSPKYKRTDNYNQMMEDNKTELPLHLYFDLQVSENSSRPQLEQLKNMFVNFQATEKDLSECINLHIYIFSKYVDNFNITNTNWGHKVENDKLSGSQKLTEIQNKCDQVTSIIKQSIYQIKQSFPQIRTSSEVVQENSDLTFNVNPEKNIIVHNEPHGTHSIGTASRFDELHTTLPTQNYNLPSTTHEINENPTEAPYVIKDNPHSMSNNNTPLLGDNTTNRTLVAEENLQIPKILTKELKNGSVISVVDGYEGISYSDFITNNIISSASDETTTSYSRNTLSSSYPDSVEETTNHKDVHNDLVEIKGNLFFLFGRNQIPARFIQQPDGELSLAIDGFSLCQQMLDDNNSKFMNLLCNCIRFQNCTNTIT